MTAEGRLGRLRYIAYGLGSFLVAGILLWSVVAVAVLWTETGASAIIVMVAGVVIGIGYLVLYILWTIRRLHDFNVNGWFTFVFILPVINLVLWLIPGARSENSYGPMQPPNTLRVILSALVTPLTFIVFAAITIPVYQDRSVLARVFAEVQGSLGWMYATGSGVPQDFVKAVKWSRLAAEQGDAYAQYNLGVMYDFSLGVSQDPVEALMWYRLAAEQGYAEAQANLGRMYDTGRGVPQDYVEALKWYRLAAEQGNANAQYNLGASYKSGAGVPQDYVAAFAWFNLAAAQGQTGAAWNRGIVLERMTPAQVAQAQQLSRTLAQQIENRAKTGASASPAQSVPSQ